MSRPKNNLPDPFEEMLTRAAKQVADEEGRRVYERYSNAPEVDFSPAFRERMQRLMQQEKKHRWKVVWGRVARQVAMLLVVCAASLTAVLSAKGVRAQLYEYLVTRGEDYTQVKITAANEEEAGGISQGDYHYEPEYLPEGYAVNEVSEEYDFFYHIEYVDPQAYAAYEQALAKQAEQYGGEGEIPQGKRVTYEGPFILYEEQRSIEGTVIFDTENAQYKELEIDGSPAYLSCKGGKTLLLWDNGDRSFSLYGTITEAQALQMAESLTRVANTG